MSKINLNEFEGHTPGPWEAPHEILVSGLNHIGPLSNGQKEVNEVDAKLIAAAPDLLAALIEAQKYKRVLDKLYKMADADPDWKELIDETWAALE